MANDTNTVVIIGHLAASMNIMHTPQGYAIGNFTLAINRNRKSKDGNWVEDAHFVDCVMYGAVVTNISEYMVKGKQVAVTGHLQQDRWEKDGQRFSRLRVAVDNLQLVGRFAGTKAATEPAVPSESKSADEVISQVFEGEEAYGDNIPF